VNHILHISAASNPRLSEAAMSAELLNLLYSFQPEDPELQSNLKYNGAARHFVNQCANVPQQQFNKGAGTSQDILEV
jgi:COP9 signalosome complex subunit 3